MRNHRLQKGQGQAEYALLLSLVAIMLIFLVSVVGKSPRQLLADVTCMLKYKSSAAHAVDTPQPAGSTLSITLGAHTVSPTVPWGTFKTTYGWDNPDKFVCIDGQVDGSGNLTAYTVYTGN